MRNKIKILLVVCFACFSQSGWAQTNTFPSSGNVGIGTNSPSEKLHLQNGELLINNGSQFIQSGLSSDNDYSRFMFNGSDNYLISYGPDHNENAHKIALKANHGLGSIGLFTNSTEQLSITSSGKVGIGTTNPSKLFHLKNGDWQQIVFDRKENENIDDLFFIGPSHGSAGVDADGLRFSSTNANKILFLQSSGKVGVGTINPTHKLTVNGITKMEEVIVDENIGADFVFEDEYSLRGLSEVEQYIQNHKHLPEIPSAEEMKREGVEVGTLQMKLLQKIEELTLYTIKQQKRIEVLEKKLSQLQNEK